MTLSTKKNTYSVSLLHVFYNHKKRQEPLDPFLLHSAVGYVCCTVIFLYSLTVPLFRTRDADWPGTRLLGTRVPGTRLLGTRVPGTRLLETPSGLKNRTEILQGSPAICARK